MSQTLQPSAGHAEAAATSHVAVIPSREQIIAAFQRQQSHQWIIRQRSPAERVQKLKDLKRAIVGHREAILDAMHADFRKNRSETELSEIQLVFTELNEAIKRTAGWMTPVRVGTPIHLTGTRSEIRYEPRGVVLIMAAWNYPFALIFAPLVAAVAAGNCVIVRPSDKVPHTSDVARRIIAEAFAPEEVLMIGGPQTTADILLDLPFDHVFFTGSTAVGRKVMAAASPHLSGVTLELGGKSPAIVDETADIDEAAHRIMWGKFVNAGQTCVAPDYAFVHATRAEEFFEACRLVLSRFYGVSDEARKTSGDYCRMIDAANWTRVTNLMGDAVRAGARIEAGGHVEESERYIAPTILSHVDTNSPIMSDEIFGPVLPVLTYHSLEEIISFLHARPKPLAMYVFSRNDDHIQQLLARTSAGGTVINNCLIHLINPGLPFGGTGDSGFGSYHGRFGFETFSHARAVMVQGRWSMAHIFYPPYARLRSGWLGALMKVARRLRD